MPNSPEHEGSPRLISIGQIAEEHGVSRSSVHTYRRSATFPQPVPAEGSTRIWYRADEVAAWFEANPPQQGRRTDLAPRDKGEPMPTTTDVAVDLVQWLRAQLDEDERIARAATQGDWVWSREFVTPPGYHHRTVGPLEPGDAAYMTTWAPARVLREVDAKRQLIARGGPFCTSDCDAPGNEPMDPETDWTTPLEHHLDCAAYKAAAVLALPYADRPGYREEWRP